MNATLEAVRKRAWRARKILVNAGKAITPAWLKYGDYLSIQFVDEAWPPVVTAAAAPLVHWPTPEQRSWFEKNAYFANRPLVLPPVLVHELKDGLIFPDTGTLATAEGWLIEESCKDRAVYAQSAAYNRLRLRKPQSMGDTLITSVLIGKLGASYGHWVMDALSRLWALSLVDEPVKLLVPKSLTGAKRRLLELTLPSNVEMVEVTGSAPVTSRRVLLSPFTTIGGSGLMRPEIAAHLRRAMAVVETRLGQHFKSPKKIYISREKAKWSNVTNESELKSALSELGIVSIVAEDLSIEEQIGHFAHADLVVGALGSGMVNCLFQKAGGTIVEFFAGGLGPNTHPPSLNAAGVAISAGIRYVPIYHGHRDPEPSYRVDVDRICDVIRRLG